MMIITKRQIRLLMNKLGYESAARIITAFFDQYRHALDSADVISVYDDEYFGNMVKRHKPMSFDYVGGKINGMTSLLDIGCGDGGFVAGMLALSPFMAVGYDRDVKLIRKANENKGEGIFTTVFPDMFKYDLVTMNDVTEHLSDGELGDMLGRIKSVLPPDGELVIYTPNGLALCCGTDRNWVSHLYRLIHGSNFVKSEYQLYYDQVHINVKSYRQLRKLLNSHGFTTTVRYEPEHRFPLWKQLSSKMMVIAKLKHSGKHA